jgi:phospholipid/cholesterol/gamma-HCH transport system substrate-binding protein
MTEETSGPEAGGRVNTRNRTPWSPPTAGGREVRVGIFVILGILGVVLLLFLLTDPGTFRGRYALVTFVEDAGGVRKGDPVQMRGVNIGRVRGFEMEDDGVNILLELNRQWNIPDDSRSRLAGVGLLGGRTIEILPGSSSRFFGPGDQVPGEFSADITDLAVSVGREVEVLVGRLQDLLTTEFIGSVQGTAEDAQGLVEDLRGVVRAQEAEVARTLQSLRASAQAVQGVAEEANLSELLTQADSALAGLERAGGALENVAGSLSTILARIEAGEGTLGRLSTDERLYDSLLGAIGSLDALLEDVRENPGRYVRIRIF